MEPNLLVSFEPSCYASAKAEVESVLKELKQEGKFLDSEIDGLFKIKIKDSKKAVKDLNKKKDELAELFEKTFHWTPIDKWVKSNIKDMQSALKKYNKEIKEKDKWMMDLNKRKFSKGGSTVDLIIKLTEFIDKPNVDLKKPDKIVKVEITGNKAGIALLNKDELFNSLKIK